MLPCVYSAELDQMKRQLATVTDEANKHRWIYIFERCGQFNSSNFLLKVMSCFMNA